MTNVLVVDDSDDIRLALRTILEEVGHEVHELSDGVEVVPWLQTNRPDMILLDVAMPIKDGFQTLAELSADVRFASIPVVMVTAKGRAQDLERARELNARDYISKPWEDGEVELRTGWILEAAALRQAS
ncbi:MAG: response regulator [Chloroflexi bacterium]|nr:response regulator [Chloroflexota bacterium]